MRSNNRRGALEMKLNVGQMLTNRADLFGKKEGFVRGDVRLTFGELNSIRIF